MQMESLSWCLSQLGPVRPLGSTLRFPDGEEWYAFGLTTNRWYRQMSLLIAMPQDSQRWRMCGDAVLRRRIRWHGEHLLPADGPLLSRMAPAPRYSSLNA